MSKLIFKSTFDTYIINIYYYAYFLLKRMYSVKIMKKVFLVIILVLCMILSSCSCSPASEDEDGVTPYTGYLKQFDDMLVAEDTAAAEEARLEALRKEQEQEPGFFEINNIDCGIRIGTPFEVVTYTKMGNPIKVRVSFDEIQEFKSEEGFKMMEGYRWIVITRRATVEDEYWNICEEDGSWYLRGLVYDYYSGKKIPYEAISVHDDQTIEKKTTTTIHFKNQNKDIIAIKEITYDADIKTLVNTYTLQIPLDYDGLTLLTAPQKDGQTDDQDDLADSLDPLDVNDSYCFLRIQ